MELPFHPSQTIAVLGNIHDTGMSIEVFREEPHPSYLSIILALALRLREDDG